MLRIALLLACCASSLAPNPPTTTTTTLPTTTVAPTEPPKPTSCTKVKVYLGTTAGSVAISEDGGTSWRKMTSVSGAIQDIIAQGPVIYVAADGGLFVSQDDGKTWNKPFSGYIPMQSLHVDGDTTWASGTGLIIKSDNHGATWAATNHPFNTRITGIFAVGTTVFAGGSGGLAISDDGGNAWRFLNAGTVFQSGNVVAIGGSNTTIYASMQASRLATTENNGKTWRSQTILPGSSGINLAVNGIWVAGPKVYLATWGKGGYGGGILISPDDGNTWQVKTMGDGLISNNISDIAAVENNIFAVSGDWLSISNDDGKTFSTATTGLENEKLYCVYAQCAD